MIAQSLQFLGDKKATTLKSTVLQNATFGTEYTVSAMKKAASGRVRVTLSSGPDADKLIAGMWLIFLDASSNELYRAKVMEIDRTNHHVWVKDKEAAFIANSSIAKVKAGGVVPYGSQTADNYPEFDNNGNIIGYKHLLAGNYLFYCISDICSVQFHVKDATGTIDYTIKQSLLPMYSMFQDFSTAISGSGVKDAIETITNECKNKWILVETSSPTNITDGYLIFQA